jgi:hypothetical protein
MGRDEKFVTLICLGCAVMTGIIFSSVVFDLWWGKAILTILILGIAGLFVGWMRWLRD